MTDKRYRATVTIFAAVALTLGIGNVQTVKAAPEKVEQPKVYPGAQPLNKPEPARTAEHESVKEPAAAEHEAAKDSAAEAKVVVEREVDPAIEEARVQNKATEHYLLGAHYFGKWDLDLAEAELDEAIKTYPDFRLAHRDMCLLAAAKFNIPRAIAEFMMVSGMGDAVPYSEKEATALDTKALKAHYQKALVYGREGDWKEAITELQWALSYDPESPKIHHSLAFAYANHGEFAKAENEYKMVFENAPNDGYAHADFANLLVERGNKQLAEDELQKAVQLAPNAAALHVDLGWMAESRNDLSLATKEFETAVQLSPKHAGLWAHLGRLLEKSGRWQDAEKAYEQAITLDPKELQAREALDRLKQEKPNARPTEGPIT